MLSSVVGNMNEQKQPSRGVLRKRYSEYMQQIRRKKNCINKFSTKVNESVYTLIVTLNNFFLHVLNHAF